MNAEVFAIELIRQFVRSGFYDPDEIVVMVDETILEEEREVDPDWLRTQVDQEFANQRADESHWDSITDCDRLDQVFESLHRQGMIALQNAGTTQSDGLDDVSQAFAEAGGEQSGIVGYCFYHWQDLERVMEGGDLFLTFGEILGDDDRGIEIGRRIKNALESAGFAVEWNGSIESRLSIQGFKWQRRRGND